MKTSTFILWAIIAANIITAIAFARSEIEYRALIAERDARQRLSELRDRFSEAARNGGEGTRGIAQLGYAVTNAALMAEEAK